MANTTGFVLIGIGQSLRGDDAAGLVAVAAWHKHYPMSAADPRLRVELAEAPGLDLLEMLEGASDALLVDAVQSDGPPGKIYTIEEDSLSAFQTSAPSVHAIGVAETLRIGRLLQPESLPQRLTLLGIQAAQFELGTGLSPAIQESIPRAVELIEEYLQNWLQAPAKARE